MAIKHISDFNAIQIFSISFELQSSNIDKKY